MRKFLWGFALVITTSIIFIACQKEISSPDEKEAFDEKAVKEWYYGTFKKSSEYAAYSTALNGRKLPDWKNGKAIKFGNNYVVDFPLVKEKKSVSFFSNSSVTDANKKRVAEASFSRIAFIKESNGKINVLEIQFIPDMDYLTRHNYDVSNNYLAHVDKDYSGMLVVKKWNGDEISRNILNNGKIIKSIKKKASNTATRGQRTEEIICIIEWAQDCETHLYGDGLFTSVCGEWYQTGNQWCFEDGEVAEHPECQNPNSPECFCVMSGLCEDPGDDPGDEPNQCNMDCAEAMQQINSITTEQLSNVEYTDGAVTPPDADGIERKPKSVTWDFFKLNFGLGFYAQWSALFNGVVFKNTNNTNWKWQSLSFNSVVKTSGSVPMCLSNSTTVSVSGPIISSDKLEATVSLTYTSQVTINCAFGTQAGTYSGTINDQTFLCN